MVILVGWGNCDWPLSEEGGRHVWQMVAFGEVESAIEKEPIATTLG